jgi:hypothetical protein
MKKLINIVMISCKQATALIDLKSARKLSINEKVKLGIHIRICNGCKTYIKQSELLDKLFQKHINSTEENIQQIENKKLQQKIISEL